MVLLNFPIFSALYDYIFPTYLTENPCPRVMILRKNVNDIWQQNLAYKTLDPSQSLEVLRGLLNNSLQPIAPV